MPVRGEALVRALARQQRSLCSKPAQRLPDCGALCPGAREKLRQAVRPQRPIEDLIRHRPTAMFDRKQRGIERQTMMTKSDTIEAILALNRTADRTFLAEFSNAELGEYLRRLGDRPMPGRAVATSCTGDMSSSPCAVAGTDRTV